MNSEFICFQQIKEYIPTAIQYPLGSFSAASRPNFASRIVWVWLQKRSKSTVPTRGTPNSGSDLWGASCRAGGKKTIPNLGSRSLFFNQKNIHPLNVASFTMRTTDANTHEQMRLSNYQHFRKITNLWVYLMFSICSTCTSNITQYKRPPPSVFCNTKFRLRETHAGWPYVPCTLH